MRIELLMRGVRTTYNPKKKIKYFKTEEDIFIYIDKYNSSKENSEFIIFDFNVL